MTSNTMAFISWYVVLATFFINCKGKVIPVLNQVPCHEDVLGE